MTTTTIQISEPAARTPLEYMALIQAESEQTGAAIDAFLADVLLALRDLALEDARQALAPWQDDDTAEFCAALVGCRHGGK